jgi:hypothetical protein
MTIKKLANISGVSGMLITIVGYIFKLMQWPWADILLLAGLGILIVVFIPSAALYLYYTK